MQDKSTLATNDLKITRRSFAALAGALGAGAALTACGQSATPASSSAAEEAEASSSAAEEAEASSSAPAEEPEPTAEAGVVVESNPLDYDTMTWSGCHVNCGSRCPLKVFTKDGVVVRIDNDNDGTDDFGPGGIYQMRSCVRGRTNRQRIYANSRVQKPMKRVEGTKRGEGKYEEISWEQAISEIAEVMKGIKEEYGNDAFYIQYGTGVLGGTISISWEPDNSMFARLLNCFGGYLRHYCDYSTGQITWELPLFNGDAWSNNEVTDLVNSKNIFLWGNNPANTRMSGSAMVWLITWVKLNNPGANIVVVDPHLSDTAVGVATEWVPVRPGTDMALITGMIHHLYKEGKLDEDYIREKFIGFYSDTFEEEVKQGEPTSSAFFGLDKAGTCTIEGDHSYEAYLNGTGAYEGTGEKTPEWAAAICGVPADKIRELADMYVDGPTATIQGWGLQRHAAGGNNTRAIGLIAAITHNVGISGGGTGTREGTGGVGYAIPHSAPNLVEKNTVERVISFFDWYQAIEDYKVMNDTTWGVRHIDNTGAMRFAEEPGELELKAPIKFIWNYGSNVMGGQHGDLNECLRLYNLPDEKDSGLRCVVTLDPMLTPTALMSDYILPCTTSFEEPDVCMGGTAWTGFALCETPGIDPMFESKSVYEVCSLLSKELGIEDEFTEGRTQEDWVKWLWEEGTAAGAEIGASFDEFKEQGLWKQTDEHEPSIPTDESIATPSGKFEVFSKQAYNLSKQWDLTCGGYVPDDGKDQITGLPIYYVAFEGWGDEEAKAEYPFQLIGHHVKTRTHSSYGNVDWMKSVAPQQLWINTQDAADLGIAEGDEVIVSTVRGKSKIPAKVTNRIMPGVVSLPQGAWYDPETRAADKIGDKEVLDRGGCISVLTSMRPTPISKGNGVHTNMCKIEKA